MTDQLTQAPDHELVKLARGRDEAAFGEIVRRYSPRVFQVAGRFFRQDGAVEDAAQEIFLRAYTRLGDYKGHGSLEGWLTRIATTTCLNLLRRAQRRPVATVNVMTEAENLWLDLQLADLSMARHRAAENSLVAADLADRVLANLSPADRLALLLVDGHEMSTKEVAALTGWSESKVKVQTFRARRRMREATERLLAGKRKTPNPESGDSR